MTAGMLATAVRLTVMLVLGGLGAVVLGGAAAAAPVETPPGNDVPLILVIDTSGSMGESVGGVVKLDAAKRSIEQVIRNQSGGLSYGVWTYPTGSSNCAPGGYLVSPSTTHDMVDVLQQVDALAARGGTPTGPALEAVIQQLSTDYAEANIVLVSDGESTCGVDPCRVAEDIAATDFDLSVHAVGFDISAEGRAELECIANATGGRYIDAEDPEELEDIIDELTSAGLELQVSADTAPLAGRPTTITASVTNVSANDASRVRVRLAFRDDGTGSIFPAVVPATYEIGNLPAGATQARSWTIVAGDRGRSEHGAYTVIAWGEDAAVARHLGEFQTRADTYDAGDAGPLLTDAEGDLLPIAILGDSFSSGEGTKDYLPGVPTASEACHRSSQSYLVPVYDDAGVGVDMLACSGAVTNDFRVNQEAGSSWRARAQLFQLHQLDRPPGAVVMSIGGNDVGFADVIAYCVDPRWRVYEALLPGLDWDCADNEEYRNSVLTLASYLTLSLPSTYRETWQVLNLPTTVAARDGRYAPLIVLGYPQLTHDTRRGACSSYTFSAREVAFANEIAATLNAAIKASVARVRAEGFEVYYVDRVASAFQPDHSVCATGGESYVNGIEIEWTPLPGPKPESYHPNAEGYAAIGETIIAWSRVTDPVPPSSAAIASAAEVQRVNPKYLWWEFTYDWVGTTESVALTLPAQTEVTVAAGVRLEIEVPGHAPLSPAGVILHSDPRVLGTLVAGEDGVVRGVVTLPEDAPVGHHEVTVVGIDSHGDAVSQSARLVVRAPMPLEVRAVMLATIVATLGAVAFAIAALRTRPRSTRPQPAGG